MSILTVKASATEVTVEEATFSCVVFFDDENVFNAVSTALLASSSAGSQGTTESIFDVKTQKRGGGAHVAEFGVAFKLSTKADAYINTSSAENTIIAYLNTLVRAPKEEGTLTEKKKKSRPTNIRENLAHRGDQKLIKVTANYICRVQTENAPTDAYADDDEKQEFSRILSALYHSGKTDVQFLRKSSEAGELLVAVDATSAAEAKSKTEDVIYNGKVHTPSGTARMKTSGPLEQNREYFFKKSPSKTMNERVKNEVTQEQDIQKMLSDHYSFIQSLATASNLASSVHDGFIADALRGAVPLVLGERYGDRFFDVYRNVCFVAAKGRDHESALDKKIFDYVINYVTEDRNTFDLDMQKVFKWRNDYHEAYRLLAEAIQQNKNDKQSALEDFQNEVNRITKEILDEMEEVYPQEDRIRNFSDADGYTRCISDKLAIFSNKLSDPNDPDKKASLTTKKGDITFDVSANSAGIYNAYKYVPRVDPDTNRSNLDGWERILKYDGSAEEDDSGEKVENPAFFRVLMDSLRAGLAGADDQEYVTEVLKSLDSSIKNSTKPVDEAIFNEVNRLEGLEDSERASSTLNTVVDQSMAMELGKLPPFIDEFINSVGRSFKDRKRIKQRVLDALREHRQAIIEKHKLNSVDEYRKIPQRSTSTFADKYTIYDRYFLENVDNWTANLEKSMAEDDSAEKGEIVKNPILHEPDTKEDVKDKNIDDREAILKVNRFLLDPLDTFIAAYKGKDAFETEEEKADFEAEYNKFKKAALSLVKYNFNGNAAAKKYVMEEANAKLVEASELYAKLHAPESDGSPAKPVKQDMPDASLEPAHSDVTPGQASEVQQSNRTTQEN